LAMSVQVSKLEQNILVELLPSDVGRWHYSIIAVARGYFPWLRGFAATAMKHKPYNFQWSSPQIELVTSEFRANAHYVMVYLRPQAVLPNATFRVDFSFELSPTWDSKRLRFYERIVNDAQKTILSFKLPKGYKLRWANAAPDRIEEKEGHTILGWALTLQGATYELDFTLAPKKAVPEEELEETGELELGEGEQ